jgi:hypothetical protein
VAALIVGVFDLIAYFIVFSCLAAYYTLRGVGRLFGVRAARR